MAYAQSWLIPIVTTLSRLITAIGCIENALTTLVIALFVLLIVACVKGRNIFVRPWLLLIVVLASTAIALASKISPWPIILSNIFFRLPPWPSPSVYQKLPLSKILSQDIIQSAPVPPHRSDLQTTHSSRHFRDASGRTVFLRGVNMGGGSKIPSSSSPHNVSYISRPIPLSTAPEHFLRLRAWGYTHLRLCLTWEAVEPTAPGQYDEGYLGYLRELVGLAGRYGLVVTVDPHQDVWSRFTGGSGAPRWTLEVMGFDVGTLETTGSAHLFRGSEEELSGTNLLWFTNHGRLATATAFTLFFAGEEFAPQLTVNITTNDDDHNSEKNVGTFLQERFIAAMVRVARELKDFPHVLGFESMNEPGTGYIGVTDLSQYWGLPMGSKITPFESMVLGSGYTLSNVGFFETPYILSETSYTLNPDGVSVWSGGGECIWKRHGVWGVDDATGRPVLLQKDYFAQHPSTGQSIDFHRDYMLPFFQRYADAIHSEIPDAFILTMPPFEFYHIERTFQPPTTKNDAKSEESNRINAPLTSVDNNRFIWAPHYYDGISLVTKTYWHWFSLDPVSQRLRLGPEAQQRIHTNVLRFLSTTASKSISSLTGATHSTVPTIVTETGISFDLYNGTSYHTHDYTTQTTSLNALLESYERTAMNFVLWNYCPDHTPARGDGWNGEDLSIFSYHHQVAGRTDSDTRRDLHAGGRALPAIVRPYPVRVAGTVIEMTFRARMRHYTLSFRHDDTITEGESILFVPLYQYPLESGGPRFVVSDGEYDFLEQEQTLIYRHDGDVEVHTIDIWPSTGNDAVSDNHGHDEM